MFSIGIPCVALGYFLAQETEAGSRALSEFQEHSPVIAMECANVEGGADPGPIPSLSKENKAPRGAGTFSKSHVQFERSLG